MFIALVIRRYWHLGRVLSMGRWKWKPGEWETHAEPPNLCKSCFLCPHLAEPTLESLRFAQLGYSSCHLAWKGAGLEARRVDGAETRRGCGSLISALTGAQGLHLLHPVQHPLLHERQALALDEPVLQNQAPAEERRG